MFRSLPATLATTLVAVALATAALATAALATAALAAPAQVTTKSDRNGTTTTITRSESSGNGTSRRQITITRRRSSGKRSAPAVVKKRYKVGEKVKVDWANKVQDAEVVGLSGTGWITVRFEHHGIQMTPTLPPDQVWRVPEKKVTDADRKVRTWSSRNGKFTVKAKFVDLDEDDNLTLEKENGATLVVALDKLSERDEKLARQLADGIDQDEQAPRRGSSGASASSGN